jgi:hypothetical protein
MIALLPKTELETQESLLAVFAWVSQKLIGARALMKVIFLSDAKK